MSPSLNLVVLCFLGAMVLIYAERTDEKDTEVSKRAVSRCSIGYCYNGGTCRRRGRFSIECQCLSGYYGDRCQYSSCGCPRVECFNGGSRYCVGRSSRCLCRPPYSGSRCQYGNGCPKGYCYNSGTCFRRGLSLGCRCRTGFWGSRCQFSCYAGYCANGGTCYTVGNFARCRCPIPYGGPRCTRYVNVCRRGYCYNGGTCQVRGGSPSCLCFPGYSGSRCEYTPCTHVRCPFHGHCRLRSHKPVCRCLRRCPKLYRPVCGSDGKTYGNSCLMRLASCLQRKYITAAHQGGCGGGSRKQCSIDDVINFVVRALPKGSAQVNNQFIEAVFQIIKGMLASRSNPERANIDELIKRIKQAMERKELSYARTVLGFILGKLPNCRVFGARVIQRVKDKVGDSIFKDIFSVNGDVSLIFAIDTTGSMAQEIPQAKGIAKAIASFKRRGQVNYILSPFNDPGSGPVQKFGHDKRSAFEAAINNLRARGGGDCAELAFNGIIDAIEMGKPLPGSPMYVFTDATPKSRGRYNKDNAISIAKAHRIPVHFFFSTFGCGNPASNADFKAIMEKTGGTGFYFGRASDIASADSLIKADLNGSVVIASGSSGSGKASDVTFPVDDSVMTLIVSISAISNHAAVNLIDSTGKSLTPSVNLVRGKMWVIENPSNGIWTLSMSSSIVLGLSYQVKASSEANINFDSIFFRTLKPSKITVPIPFPLKGEKANVQIIIPQASRLDMASLKLDLVDERGEVIKSVPLQKNQLASFDLPSKPFKLRLSGKTKTGSAFQRMSSEEIRPQDAMIRLQFHHAFLSLERGKTTSLGAAIDFVGSGSKTFSITATATPTNIGVKVKTNSITVTKAKPGEIFVDLSVPADTPVGTVVKVQITATSGSLKLRLLAQVMVLK